MAEGAKYTWDSIKPMPTKRVYAAPVVLDDVLYVIGGCDKAGIPVDNFESIAQGKKNWNRLANMPTKRAGVCAMGLNGKVYAIGGVGLKQEPVDKLEIYDPKTKTWTEGSCLRERLLGLSAVIRGKLSAIFALKMTSPDGKIYVVGGMGMDTNPQDYFNCYDPVTEQWSALPPMPTARYATFSFLINDKLYVLGGRQGKLPVAAFEMYDFETRSWTKLPDIPSKRVFALYTSTDAHIYSVGGLDQTSQKFTNCVEVFTIERGEWTIGAPMTNERGDFAAGIMDNKLVITGGLGRNGKPLAETEMYDHVTDTWTKMADMPSQHCSCAFTTWSENFYVIGGLSVGGPSGAVEFLKKS